jgi:hypothetical protein
MTGENGISGVALANGDVAMAEGSPVGTDAWPPAATQALSAGQVLLDRKLACSFEKERRSEQGQILRPSRGQGSFDPRGLNFSM